MLTRSRIVIAALGALIAVSGCTSGGTNGTVGSPGTTASTGATAPGETAQDPDYGATLQKQIPEIMKANAIPGVVVLVKSPERGDWIGDLRHGRDRQGRADVDSTTTSASAATPRR